MSIRCSIQAIFIVYFNVGVFILTFNAFYHHRNLHLNHNHNYEILSKMNLYSAESSILIPQTQVCDI